MKKNFCLKKVSNGSDLLYLCRMEPRTNYILQQVTKLYQRYGIKSVTMDDVSHHLGISKKTLYQHFRNKEDLVDKIMRLEHEKNMRFQAEFRKKKMNAIEELLEVYRAINSILKEYNPSMEYDIRKYYPSLYMKFRQIRRKEMYQSTFANISRGIKEGFYREDLDADLITRLQVARFENLVDNDIFTLNEQVSVRFFHELFLYHIYGILNRKGLEFFERNFDNYKAKLT